MIWEESELRTWSESRKWAVTTLRDCVTPRTAWSWKKMLDGMTDAALNRVVGIGIVGITCQFFRNADSVPIWEFVVTRMDGTRVRFHPKPTNRDISITDWCACSECPDQPRVMQRCLCTFRLYAAVAADLPQDPAALAAPNRKSPTAKGNALLKVMKSEGKSPTRLRLL